MTASQGIAHASTFATHAASSLWAIGGGFLLVIVLFAALLLFAWYIGHGPFTALLISFYGAYAVYAVFPYFSLLPSASPLVAFFMRLGVYIVFALAFYVVLRRIIVSDFLHIGWFGLIVLALLGAGFLIALLAHAFALSSVDTLTPAVATYIASSKYFFWWFIAPAVGLLVFAR